MTKATVVATHVEHSTVKRELLLIDLTHRIDLGQRRLVVIRQRLGPRLILLLAMLPLGPNRAEHWRNGHEKAPVPVRECKALAAVAAGREGVSPLPRSLAKRADGGV